MPQLGLEVVDAAEMQQLLPTLTMPATFPDYHNLPKDVLHEKLATEVRRLIPRERHQDDMAMVEYGANVGSTAVRVTLNNYLSSRTAGIAGETREHLVKIAYPLTTPASEAGSIQAITFGAADRHPDCGEGFEDPQIFLLFAKQVTLHSGYAAVGLSVEDVEHVKPEAARPHLVDELFADRHMIAGLRRTYSVGIGLASHLPQELLQPVEEIEDLYPLL